jgi:hypothetical protein
MAARAGPPCCADWRCSDRPDPGESPGQPRRNLRRSASSCRWRDARLDRTRAAVTPVIRQAFLDQKVVHIILVYRQKLYCIDTQLRQMRDLLDQAQIGPRVPDPGRRMGGEALQVHFVINQLLQRQVGRGNGLPIERIIDDNTLRYNSRIIPCIRRPTRRPWLRIGG